MLSSFFFSACFLPASSVFSPRSRPAEGGQPLTPGAWKFVRAGRIGERKKEKKKKKKKRRKDATHKVNDW